MLTGYPEIRSDYFLEHREVGIINVGDTGTVTVDDETYELIKGACLYLGCGLLALALLRRCGRASHDQFRGNRQIGGWGGLT